MLSFSFNKLFVSLILFFLLHEKIYAQTEFEEINIEYADELEGITVKGISLRILRGNVQVSQDSVRLFCDSAYLNQTTNTITAYGHVHIEQPDSVNTYSDSAVYNGNTKIAILYQNVKLTDNKTTITTDFLTYDLNNKIGTYQNGGKVLTGETVLTSAFGYYYTSSDDAYFKTNVLLNHPEYQLEADTLRYNTQTERAFFLGPTIIHNEKSNVYCENGYYDSRTGIAVFNKHVLLNNPPQILQADSIYYNRETGSGKAFNHVIFRDTLQNILQYSNVAIYNENNKTIESTNGAMAAYVFNLLDTLFIAGDTILALEDSLKKKTMLVYHNVKIFKEDLQGRCDSLYYSDSDSILRMYGIPYLWSDSTQFSSDTIFLSLKNKSIDQIQLHSNGFIVNFLDSLIYNQLKGRTIYGYFKNDTLYKLEALGNGESLYFGQDEQLAFVGVNYVQCSEIKIKVKSNKFSRVSFINNPEAKFTPMQFTNSTDFFLLDLNWQFDTRPQSKEDLLKPNQKSDETENPSDFKSSQKDG